MDFALQTTFFAAIETQLLDIITPDRKDLGEVQKTGMAAAATLSSALVVHSFAGTFCDRGARIHSSVCSTQNKTVDDIAQLSCLL